MSDAVVFEVITTEKVPFTYRVAGLGSRFLAWLVDTLIILLLAFVGNMLASVLEAGREGLGMAFMLLWIFGLLFGYFLFFEWLWHGQTPGKRLLGIRVITEQGTRLGFYQSAVRNIIRIVDALIFMWLGVLIALCHPTQRRLGDWKAGTLVVHVDRKAKPIRALHEGDAEKLGLSEPLLRQRLGQLTRAQKQTLLDLCLRREQLRLSDRARLFAAVAEYLKVHLDLVPGEHQSDEKFLVSLAAVLTSQGG